MTVCLIPALCLSLFLAGAAAQGTAAQPARSAPATAVDPKPDAGDPVKPPVPETLPDQKAYRDAYRIADPGEKIEALEKLKKDFPESIYVAAADTAILSTLATKMPDQTARMRRLARAIYKAAEARDNKDAAERHRAVTGSRRGSAASNIAYALLNGNVLLKDAESYSRKSIDAMKLAIYLSEQREAYAKQTQNIPSTEELSRRFMEQRAGRVGILGRIEQKLGKTKAAKALLREAYGVNNGNSVVAAALGEIAAQEGDNATAYEYLLSAKLGSGIPNSASAIFESLYKQRHNGSLETLDATLDAEYHKRFPNPVQAVPYQATAARTDRVVLAELFTGAGCGPCVAADLAFDAALERFSRKDLVVVMYHQHIPAPDPMTNPDTQARAKSYSVPAVPTSAIEGHTITGGGPRSFASYRYDLIRNDVEKALETAAEAGINVDAALAGNTVTVAAYVSGIRSESKNLKVQILLLEKELRYTGENGIRFHPMVVRAMGGENAEGYSVEPDGTGEYHASFDLDAVSKALKDHLDDYEAKGHRGSSFTFREKKFQINPHGIAVAVFVQDDKTKHVLQSAYVDFAPAGVRSTTEAQ